MRSDSFPVPILPALTVALALGLALARLWPAEGDLGSWLRGWVPFGPPVVFAALAALAWTGKARAWGTASLALVFFLFAGMLSGWMSSPPPGGHPALEPFYDRPHTLFATTVDAPAEFLPGKVRLALRIDDAFVASPDAPEIPEHRVPVGTAILLSFPNAHFDPSSWLPGDRFLVRLTIKRFHNFAVPNGFDYSRYQAERGLFGRAYLSAPETMLRLAPAPSSFPWSLPSDALRHIDEFRQSALEWFTASLRPETASFLAAMLIGYQKLIPPDWNEHLNRTGLNHLLSISGLHLGLVAFAIFWITRRLLRRCVPSLLARVPDQHIAIWPTLAAVLAYALVSGFGSAPVWRSLIMLALCFGALLLYRGSDAVSSLSAAALLILLVDPASLWQVSFQLSFTCMLGLFFIYPRIRRWRIPWLESEAEGARLPRKLLNPFMEAFRVSVAVSIVVLPLTAAYFHGVSVALYVANVVVVPVFGFLVLPIGLTALALFALSPWVAGPFLQVAGWITGVCQSVIVWFSGFSWAYFWVGEIGILTVIVYYAALVLVLSPLPFKTRTAAVLALALVALVLPNIHRLLPSQPDRKLRLTVLDVGQGTANLLQFPDGRSMLVDGGGFPDRSYDVGRQVLAPFLWWTGVRRLDVVALSHDHPDHADGLRFILSHFEVGEFWESGLTTNPRGWSTLSEIAHRRGIPVRGIMETEEPTTFGECAVRAIHPSRSYTRSEAWADDLNKVSLVLRIDYGATHLLLPGDVDQSVENLLAEREPSPSGQTLLVAAHHGSRRSTGERLLDHFLPRWVVFSCGYGNSYGFPAREVLERCRARGINVLRTDLDGTIQAVSDGQQWSVSGTVRRRGERDESEGSGAADARRTGENGHEELFPGGHSRKPSGPRGLPETSGQAESP